MDNTENQLMKFCEEPRLDDNLSQRLNVATTRNVLRGNQHELFKLILQGNIKGRRGIERRLICWLLEGYAQRRKIILRCRKQKRLRQLQRAGGLISTTQEEGTLFAHVDR